MTALRILLGTLVPLTFGSPAAAAPPNDRQAILAVLEAQVAAWNKGDLDGFMTGYWNDEKLTFISGGDIRHGWKQTKERFAKRYGGKAETMGRLAFAELGVDVLSPDAAAVRGEFILVRGTKTDRGRFTLIVRKLPAGWKIVHDHTSVNCPEPEKK